MQDHPRNQSSTNSSNSKIPKTLLGFYRYKINNLTQHFVDSVNSKEVNSYRLSFPFQNEICFSLSHIRIFVTLK